MFGQIHPTSGWSQPKPKITEVKDIYMKSPELETTKKSFPNVRYKIYNMVHFRINKTDDHLLTWSVNPIYPINKLILDPIFSRSFIQDVINMWELGITSDHFPSSSYKENKLTCHCRPVFDPSAKILPKTLFRVQTRKSIKLIEVAQRKL